jgi:DNA polymerase III subunit delta'
MDQQTIIPKATLLIGKETACYTKIVQYLQGIYCKSKCSACSICTMIQQKQHYNIYWMGTEQAHNVNDFSQIEHMISYKRDDEIPFFFIISAVDFLSKSCANSLLKLLEGSEKNYFFLLTATRKNAVIPTIASRCFVNYCQIDDNEGGLLSLGFSKYQPPEYTAFLQLLEQYKTKQEREILAEYNDLLSFWLETYAHCKNETEKKRISTRIDLIKQYVVSGIPSGSFPFMLRTLYLRWIELCQRY